MKLVSVFCAFSTLVLFLTRADGASIFVTDVPLQGPTPIFSFGGDELCVLVNCGWSLLNGSEGLSVLNMDLSSDQRSGNLGFSLAQDNPVFGGCKACAPGDVGIPEPSTFGLILVGVVGLMGYRSYKWTKSTRLQAHLPKQLLKSGIPSEGVPNWFNPEENELPGSSSVGLI